MKTIINSNGEILRVTDIEAEAYILKGYEYVGKETFKTEVRDARKIELEQIETEKAEAKKEAKAVKKSKKAK